MKDEFLPPKTDLNGLIQAPADTNARPTGIRLLAIVAAINGFGSILIAAIGAGTGGLARFLSIGEAYAGSTILVIVSFAILIGLPTVAAIGLFRMAKWGWWFACLTYLYGITRYVNVLLLSRTFEGSTSLLTRYAGRAVFAVFILVYLYSSHVRTFFAIDKPWKTLGIQIAAIAGMILLTTGLRLVLV